MLKHLTLTHWVGGGLVLILAFNITLWLTEPKTSQLLFELEGSAPADRRPIWVNVREIQHNEFSSILRHLFWPDTPILYAHSPATLSLNVAQHTTKVSFGFGMVPGVELGLAGDGVIFRILGEKNVGERVEVLFEMRLDPAHNPSDLGRHTGKASFTAGQYKRLIFETNPGPAGDSAYDASYWSDVVLQ